MGSLFAPRPASIKQPANNVSEQSNNDSNAINYAQTMLQRSGGDAKAAFYMAAKEKGIDPETILAQVRSIKDPRAMLQTMMARNPKAQGLMSLFSMIK